ncbi:transcriptional regulator QRICH1-like [Mercenaria mercenaria]|uniref:transcriptional regulator QRICH1-like n=1 Tax=Mercenaria mercenaria TaxID=6596 RepID=UPI00234E750C|nr:transcriptional regulator QRICH1-like [Mercenaria mercenaria]
MKMRGKHIPEIQECDINNHLSRFIVEARKQDGSSYPPASLYSIACGLLRHLRENGIYDCNFLDPNKSEYTRFREVLDAQMKKLTKEGVGLPNREAKPVTEEDESLLWKKGVFGSSTSLALQHTMYFYNCKFFGLRAYDEHKELMCNQFTIDKDENGLYVEFKGTNSKTFSGGLKHRKVDAKVIRHYDESSGIVAYYKDYLEALGNNGYFYRRPLSKQNGNVRYSEQPVGINKLRCFMKDMCSLAGLEGRYTNHSGKKTCATTLYQKGVPEEEIMKRTGHRSIAGVRKYQKPSGQMLKDISNKLNPPCSVKSEGQKLEKTGTPVQSTLSCSVTNEDKEIKTTETKIQSNSSVIQELFARNNSFSGCTFNF